MAYYEDKASVEEYLRQCLDYDGAALYPLLAPRLGGTPRLLELGSGPGNDLTFLQQHCDVTASDLSDAFLQRLARQYPAVPRLKLNAHTLDHAEQYDWLFSNKVLHHLNEEQLKESLTRQKALLSPGGRIAHTFWQGKGGFIHDDLTIRFYQPDQLKALFEQAFNSVEIFPYADVDAEDSLLVLAQL
ncbi:class I SAM-dependent methyltransferase [Ferrimonas pelagia]|uniref:Methyltransferase type 12 domain-containing protein n=1 Tax=Ferrimonas pelagia TaxID=1177826 RepID=A0ABP9EHK7_9GAMM